MSSNTRRTFLQGALSAPALMAHPGGIGSGQSEAASNFPGVAYRNYPRCLPDYLRKLASAAQEKRNAELARIVSAQTVRGRQGWVKKTLLDLIGELPEKTSLNAKVVASLDRQGYRIERIVYESRPRLYVSANLYIPTSVRPPFPGVLFQLGHSDNGKAWHSYQRACQGMARLGFLVLAFDPIGQGERINYPDSTGVHTRLPGGPDEEHTLPGKQMLLTGTTCTQFQLWDAIRSLDYLAAHPLVDATKLGGTGQSGGATLTMLLVALDDRLRAGAIFSANTENVACKNFLPPGSTDDAEQNFVGAGPLGFDRWDLLYPFAPKPMLISISTKDSFGTYSPNYVVDSWEEYKRLAHIYRLMGAPQLLSWADTPLPHGLSYDSRLHMYNWFLRHLKGVAEPVHEEPKGTPELDADLWVSKSGNVVRSLGGETPFSLTKMRAATLRPPAKSSQLAQLLGVERPQQQAPTVSLRKVPSQGGITIEALDVPSVAGVHLPAWLFRPKQDASAGCVLLILHPQGRNAAWVEDELCQQLALSGHTVCAADVRGIGDLSPEFSPGAPNYARSHQMEEEYAWSSLILGKPLIGQRVTDVLALIQGLRTGLGLQGRKIAIAAFGKMTTVALFAAALDPAIDRLYLAGGLSSFRNIVETEHPRHPFADFVPNILAHTDLPEVVTGLAPRRVVISGPIDAEGASHAIIDARRIYAAALQGKHLDLREKAEWSAVALSQFCA